MYAFVFIYISIAIMTIGCLSYMNFYRPVVMKNSLKTKCVFIKFRKIEDLPLVVGYFNAFLIQIFIVDG